MRRIFLGLMGLLSILISLPIWFFLFYKILETIHASELMWFLYWVYVPITLTLAIVSKLLEEAGKDL